ASALLAAPANGITLDDKRRATERLLRSGADIHALNTVRKHLSAIKGGWLAARAQGRCRAFAVSDVVDDDLSVIGSGPTVADATTCSDALNVARLYGGAEGFPQAIVSHLESGTRRDLPEPPKPDDPRLRHAVTTVVGGRRDAMEGAAREARERGYRVVCLDDPVVGEARVTSLLHLRAAVEQAAAVERPVCAGSSGETTVR